MIALIPIGPGRGPPNAILIGFSLGTIFGQTTLAATWTAFGPLSLVRRLPLSLAWMGLLGIAIAINIGLQGRPSDAPFVIGACLLGQWLLLQLPLAGLSIGFGLRLRHADSVAHGFDPRELQFGIRQLIIVTAVVGIVLGVGRAVVTQWSRLYTFSDREAPIFIFLGAASVVLTFPLILAMLMRHLTFRAVALVLVLIGLATAWEFPLLKSLHGGPRPGLTDFIAINVFMVALILLVLTRCAGTTRGYRCGW